MIEAGFVLAQVHPVSIHNRARISATEFDCLFRPIDPPSTERKSAGRGRSERNAARWRRRLALKGPGQGKPAVRQGALPHCDPGHSILGRLWFIQVERKDRRARTAAEFGDAAMSRNLGNHGF